MVISLNYIRRKLNDDRSRSKLIERSRSFGLATSNVFTLKCMMFFKQIFNFSTRTPGGPGNAKKRLTKEDTDDDLTRDMDDPLPETNIQEVQLSKQCKFSQNHPNLIQCLHVSGSAEVSSEV